MATITKRKVKGHVYYYLVEGKRVGGKSRLVKQQYLGRAEQVVARLEGQPPEPTRVRVAEYGGSQALLTIARRLRLVEFIDAVAPKRDQGLSVGTYILLAVLNRVLAPCSKARLGEWFRQTALYHDVSVRGADLRSQRFWDHMGHLTADRIRAVERTLTRHMVQEFGLDLATVVYDATNFYPGIDTQTASELAQRGHQKQHRGDLKAVGLALLVTTDFNIPLFHAVYPGNRADTQQFQSVTEELIDRYQTLRTQCDGITLVYDKGNNSQANQTAVDGSPYGFVGSLKANQVPELLTVPANQYTSVPEFGDLQAFRTTATVFGCERTVVMTYNEALFLGQWQGEFARLRKLHERLRAIQKGLETARRRPSVAALQQRVARTLAQAGPHLHNWVTTSVTATPEGPRLTFSIDHNACMEWGNAHWGKTILFTDHAEWSTAQIVATYRDAWHVEDTFRDMKQPSWLRWQPQFHWTDDKIRVHAFICVLAVTLAHLLRREVARAGVALSLPQLLRDLTTVQEVLWEYPPPSPLGVRLTLTDRTRRQQQILDSLQIPEPMAKPVI